MKQQSGISFGFFVIMALLVMALAPCMAQIVCPGSYGGHLQGVATDSAEDIYWSFTTELVRTDIKGSLLTKCSVPTHHGDLTYHDGKIYVAVNLGKFNKEAGYAKSWVYVYDAKKLELVSKHSIPEVVHGAGGIEYRDGHFYVVGGLPEGHTANYVYDYDRDFKFLKKHTIKSGYTHLGIQTVCFAQGYWWFGCYGKELVLLRTDALFQSPERFNFYCALGICSFSDDTFLIGRGLKNERLRGRVLKAKMDQDKGLVIVEEKAE